MKLKDDFDEYKRENEKKIEDNQTQIEYLLEYHAKMLRIQLGNLFVVYCEQLGLLKAFDKQFDTVGEIFYEVFEDNNEVIDKCLKFFDSKNIKFNGIKRWSKFISGRNRIAHNIDIATSSEAISVLLKEGDVRRLAENALKFLDDEKIVFNSIKRKN